MKAEKETIFFSIKHNNNNQLLCQISGGKKWSGFENI
jgi:hypothetical protein